MLTKCVLCAPPRAGKEHKNQRVSFTRSRLNRWLDGDRATLWQDIPNYRTRQHRTRAMSVQAEQGIRQKRCIDWCGEGADSKACQALIQPPPLQHTGELVREMQDKHPRAEQQLDMSQLGAANVALTPTVDCDMISNFLISFSKHAAAGPLVTFSCAASAHQLQH